MVQRKSAASIFHVKMYGWMLVGALFIFISPISALDVDESNLKQSVAAALLRGSSKSDAEGCNPAYAPCNQNMECCSNTCLGARCEPMPFASIGGEGCAVPISETHVPIPASVVLITV